MKANPPSLLSAELVVDSRGRGVKSLEALENNRLIKARVVEVFSTGDVKLEIAGRMLRAKSDVLLRGGEKLTLKIIPGGDQNTLKICSLTHFPKNDLGSYPYQFFAKDGALAALRQVLTLLQRADVNSVNPHLQATAQKIRDHLRQVALRSDVADVDGLKQAMDMFGTTYEHKLSRLTSSSTRHLRSFIPDITQSDMKALVLTLKQPFSGAGSEGDAKLTSFIEGFEQLQLFNQISHETNGRILLPLPLLFDDRLSFGQLFWDFGHQRKAKSKRSEGLLSIAFLLDLPRWGALRADFSLYKKTLAGHFAVAASALKIMIDRQLPHLTQKLRENSFDVKRMTCRVLQKGDPKGVSLMDKVAAKEGSTMNLVI